MVVGGIGSITGSVISGVIVTVAMEALRIVDGNIDLGFMVIKRYSRDEDGYFSILLMVIILFFRRGIIGTNNLAGNGY